MYGENCKNKTPSRLIEEKKTGNIRYSAYVKKLVDVVDVKTKLVGFDGGRIADAKFAAVNCENKNAVGGCNPVTLVKYARKAVPLNITGS